MRLEMHSFKTTNEPRKLPWWRRLNDFPNPTLDALLTLFGVMVIVAVIYLFSPDVSKSLKAPYSIGIGPP
jgi:hypothetical protein